MSNPRAIAAVTATLRHILDGTMRSLLQHVYSDDTELQNILITTKPPDKARDDQNNDQLNLFLYQVLPNAAWRNMDIPQHLRSGETGIPPLALNLYYMLTAYGKDN